MTLLAEAPRLNGVTAKRRERLEGGLVYIAAAEYERERRDPIALRRTHYLGLTPGSLENNGRALQISLARLMSTTQRVTVDDGRELTQTVNGPEVYVGNYPNATARLLVFNSTDFGRDLEPLNFLNRKLPRQPGLALELVAGTSAVLARLALNPVLDEVLRPSYKALMGVAR